jgi:hypothetical protein
LFLEYIGGIPVGVVPINIIWIALNRYVAVCWYEQYEHIFGGKTLPTANYESSTYHAILPIMTTGVITLWPPSYFDASSVQREFC